MDNGNVQEGENKVILKNRPHQKIEIGTNKNEVIIEGEKNEKDKENANKEEGDIDRLKLNGDKNEIAYEIKLKEGNVQLENDDMKNIGITKTEIELGEKGENGPKDELKAVKDGNIEIKDNNNENKEEKIEIKEGDNNNLIQQKIELNEIALKPGEIENKQSEEQGKETQNNNMKDGLIIEKTGTENILEGEQINKENGNIIQSGVGVNGAFEIKNINDEKIQPQINNEQQQIKIEGKDGNIIAGGVEVNIGGNVLQGNDNLIQIRMNEIQNENNF